MEKSVIGLGPVVETVKNGFLWSIIIQNYILTEKYDVSLEVKGKKKTVRVNEKIVFDGNDDPTFQIGEFHQGTIVKTQLFVDSIPYDQLIDKNYVYQPPNIDKELKVQKPKTKTVLEAQKQKVKTVQEAQKPKITMKDTPTQSVFDQIKRLKKQQMEILMRQREQAGNK